jgi:hypothetical protein
MPPGAFSQGPLARAPQGHGEHDFEDPNHAARAPLGAGKPQSFLIAATIQYERRLSYSGDQNVGAAKARSSA